VYLILFTRNGIKQLLYRDSSYSSHSKSLFSICAEIASLTSRSLITLVDSTGTGHNLPPLGREHKSANKARRLKRSRLLLADRLSTLPHPGAVNASIISKPFVSLKMGGPHPGDFPSELTNMTITNVELLRLGRRIKASRKMLGRKAEGLL
jgi:hypothetical protein